MGAGKTTVVTFTIDGYKIEAELDTTPKPTETIIGRMLREAAEDGREHLLCVHQWSGVHLLWRSGDRNLLGFAADSPYASDAGRRREHEPWSTYTTSDLSVAAVHFNASDRERTESFLSHPHTP
jgi:hypothetical protein